MKNIVTGLLAAGQWSRKHLVAIEDSLKNAA
jgi:hypothetical protein